MHNKYSLYVVSHTHWDREWYQTFEQYRKRLVYFMDDLLDHMEKDNNYKYFHLDGQTIVLEDYLEIRPENELRLRKMIKAGRIIIGPWYAMPDEFLITGESIVRNLQKGFQISHDYGVEPMRDGYVVDIFGHNSQFPQILKGFGIESATLFRGIGDYPKDSFIWEGADGSKVLVAKLDRGRSYSNFYFAIRWPFEGREFENKELIERMKKHLEYIKEFAVSDNLLMMDGVDHIEIEPKLPEIIEELKLGINEIDIIHCRLEDYVNAQKNHIADMETIHGELYNIGYYGVNNQVLKNVLSSMVHIKQLNNECETLLTKWAEPFDTFAGLYGVRNNSGFFNKAWEYLMKNHPHDSICGCSITRVHQDNVYRFNQVKDIGIEIQNMAFDDISKLVDTSNGYGDRCFMHFNGSQRDISGVVEATISLEKGEKPNFELFDDKGNMLAYQILDVNQGDVKMVHKFRQLIGSEVKDKYQIAFEGCIPSLGYTTYFYKQYNDIPPQSLNGDYGYNCFHQPTRFSGSMRTGNFSWENDLIIVNINSNGTLDVTYKPTEKEYKGLLIFEDGADVGDGWNYRKPLKDSVFLSNGVSVDISIENDGPLIALWKIVHTMTLPEKINNEGTARSVDTKKFKITSFIKMKKDSAMLEVKTIVDNNVCDHRLRVLFPTYLETDKFSTTTPFMLQERNIHLGDTTHHVEVETNVFPNQGVVYISDEKDAFAVYNKGLYEVEVSDNKNRNIALTLFRSFKNEVGRKEGELSYMLMPMTFEYALQFGNGDLNGPEAVVAGESWRCGLKEYSCSKSKGSLSTTGSFLKVNIPGTVLSACKSGQNSQMIIRLYNCFLNDVKGEICLHDTPRKVSRLNLNDEFLEEIDFNKNSIPVEIKAAQVLNLGIKYL